MKHRLFGLAMLGKGVFAGAALAMVRQGGESTESPSTYASQQASVKIQRIQSIDVQPAGLPASGSDGILTQRRMATSHQSSWVF